MPVEKRWGEKQERDLAIAIILSQAGDRPKYNWEKITEIMGNLGHGFTRDAINQHWSKRIMKEFKERHGEDAAKGGLSSAHDSPKEDGSKPATPGSTKRKRAVKKSAVEGTPTKGATLETPSSRSPIKKPKLEVEPKEEQDDD